jgi:hypothetical protein
LLRHKASSEVSQAQFTIASLTSRAEAILAQAKKIDAYLEEKNIPYSSFEHDTLKNLPVEPQDVRWSLVNDSNDLKKLARGAVMHTMGITFSVG